MNVKEHTTGLGATLAAVTIVWVLTGQVSRAAEQDKMLFDFTAGSPGAGWRTVNDNVMGGVSTGGHKLSGDGSLLFSGNLSLENRGGFASIRSPRKRSDLSAYDALAIRVRGDGRTYWLTVNTNVPIPAGSYRVLVRTQPGKWQTFRAPFSTFRATSFGRVLPVFLPLNPAKVESIGFLIADKKAGPFRLEIDWIKAAAKAPAAPATPAAPTADAGPKDIVDTAVAAGKFNTLAKALTAAGLIETLKGKGPFTVFAPVDEAFAKLPQGVLARLLRPENKKQLTRILTYHVVPGRVTLGSQSLKTVEGSALAVAAGKGLTVSGAQVVTADIFASNGVIHVIDKVLLPKPPKTVAVSSPRDIIVLAITRGVPLYNRGEPGACAAIYEVAAQSLLRMEASALKDADRKVLKSALDNAAALQDARASAWALRRALDHVYHGLRR